MDAYALHLAMAALIGASFVAVSAYYMHNKTLDQLLEFAKIIEKEDDESTLHYKRKKKKKLGGSSSDVTDVIPPGLPRLRTLPQDKSEGGAHRPNSPIALESGQGSSDDEAEKDTTYFHTNGNDVSQHVIPNGEQLPIAAAASNMIRSHSVSGDLHGVQPDPVVADILRKEPEHETFVRLRITPSETPSADEAEVYKALQVCLEMRKSYVFRESFAPWEKQVISDPSTPKRNPNPFEYTPETKSNSGVSLDATALPYGSKVSD